MAGGRPRRNVRLLDCDDRSAVLHCPHVIVENGKPIWDTMHRNHISQHDLEEDLRLEAHTEDLAKIKIARIERSVFSR